MIDAFLDEVATALDDVFDPDDPPAVAQHQQELDRQVDAGGCCAAARAAAHERRRARDARTPPTGGTHGQDYRTGRRR